MLDNVFGWPIHYEEPVFRPPSEAQSLILQLTVGCSWNRCTYCGMYRMKQYRVRPIEELIEEIRGSAAQFDGVRRVFLADGDALAAPSEVLEAVLREVRESLPSVQRVGIYGDSRCILDKGAEELAHLSPAPTPWSPFGLRIVIGADAKGPPIHAEPAYLKGHVEVQDEGSQLAAVLTGAKPGEQAIDLCAGGGGKTLALAALMENHGQIYATDFDMRRLAPIHARLVRAGVRNVQVRTPRRPDVDVLADQAGRADLVLIDAPCTGTGTWRRNPDAKWRVRPGALAERVKEQANLLDRATSLVKPGGRIAYVTCSVLAEENGDQVQAFLARHPEFFPAAAEEVASALVARAAAFLAAVRVSREGLLMTARRTGTDGFYISLLRCNLDP